MTHASTPRLILASASPRRGILVGLLGLAWRAAPANIDEDAFLLPNPVVAALNVALAKAQAVPLGAQDSDQIVLAADTMVIADGHSLGKPSDAEQASAMLRQLRGRTHAVVTGVALCSARRGAWGGIVSTRVAMRPYSEAEIAAYIARGEPFDKAGGYAVQDALFRPVAGYEGCYLNVVGLPLCAVAAGLEALGVAIDRPASLRPPCDYCRRGDSLVALQG